MTTSDPQAAFASTFVDEIVRNGVTDAVVAPGKRSSIIAAALERDTRIRVHVIVDERAAGFFALGLSTRSGRPALVWCTSGTAASELHAAVLEASYARVPMLICTADRPPELHHVRDWQSIDQTHLYGRAPRWYFDLGVARDEMRAGWRSIISRAVIETTSNAAGPGPVHLNVPIREPVDVSAVPPEPGRPREAAWHSVTRANVSPPAAVVDSVAGAKRGVIVAGRGASSAEAVHACALSLGWPVITQARSGVRVPVDTTIAAADGILRSTEFKAKNQPDVIVHLGDPLISRSIDEWLSSTTADLFMVESVPTWQGAAGAAASLVTCEPNLFCEGLRRSAPPEPADNAWLAGWRAAEIAAQHAIDESLSSQDTPTEPGVARALVAALPDGANLFCSTSMPVRDVEWYSSPRHGLDVFANRGVSGLDGVTSTAAGMAAGAGATGGPNVLLTGDLGFLYDLNALWAIRSSLQLTIVVVDNNGGGIFSMFPIEQDLGSKLFERVVATPHDADIPSAVTGLGIPVQTVAAMSGFNQTLDEAISSSGIRVIRIRTDRHQNARLHESLNAAIVSAVNKSIGAPAS